MRTTATAIVMSGLLGVASADAMDLTDGNLLVGYADGLIAQFDPAGDVVDGFFSFIALRGIDVGAAGELVLFDGAMIRWTTDSGAPLREIPSPIFVGGGAMGGNSDPFAVGPGGEIFLQSQSGTTVYVLDRAGAFVDFFALPGEGNAPYGAGLAASASGEIVAALYYYNDRNSQIFRLAPDGTVLDASERISDWILAVAVDDDDGILYATATTAPPSFWQIGVTLTRLDHAWAPTASVFIPMSGYGFGGLTTVRAPEAPAFAQAACVLATLACAARRALYG